MSSLATEIRTAVPGATVVGDVPQPYLVDETETRSVVGRADAVVFPESARQVADVVAFAHDRGVPVVARGGGTGYAGGAVPNGGIVISTERLNRVRSFDPLLWRMNVDAGIITAEVRRQARESGLFFPPDPGAAEQSHIGGNIATNAGGPHAFKYGTTGAWVTGIEAVVCPGEIVELGGRVRKDVAGYDLKNLLIGSEGTLGIITGAWLRFIPAPEAALPVVALFTNAEVGCEAVQAVIGSGAGVAALEFVDGGALACSPPPFFDRSLDDEAFVVLLEADGDEEEAQRTLGAAREACDAATAIYEPRSRLEIADLWRWREGMTGAVTTRLGGKISEDIVVPVDRLAEAIKGTREIGDRHGLASCSWGHAGDGNLHSTFLIRKDHPEDVRAAEDAAAALFALALRLGGSISGEHGIGWEKRGYLEGALGEKGYSLHAGIKQLFDPKGILNPGKKI